MRVGELMRRDLVSVGPTHTLRQAAKLMAEHNVGSAVVRTDEAPGIVSERDVLRAVAEGADPDEATVGDHMTWDAVVASPSWDVYEAVRTMIRGGFRHLIVVEDGREVGILSIRDIAIHLLPEGERGDTAAS